MNDLEFAQYVSPRIGELYAEAKRSQHRFPKHALIQTRALASLCCDLLGQDGPGAFSGLDEKIRTLYRMRRINPGTRDVLDDLRRWGNLAAHPEESRCDDTQFGIFAGKALQGTITLLDTVFRHHHNGATLPSYSVVEEQVYELPEACYRALIDNSSADQYQVAMLLRQQLARQIQDIETGPDAFLNSYTKRFEFGALESRALDLLRYASDASYPPASYQYGLALSEGRRGADYVAFGVNLIAIAARDGNIDACAWCGNAAMHGLHDEPVDYERARGYLERAAADDQPLALSLLSRMYRQGLGVMSNASLAFSLTLRSAEAGYPVAQYDVGVALYRGQGVEIDKIAALDWLQKASDAGLPEAQLVVGNFVRRGTLPGGFNEAERLLERAARKVNEARLDLAELYMTRAEPRLWINASGFVQAAYETALEEKDEKMAERACGMAPAVITRLEELSRVMSDEEHKDFLLSRFLFDERRRPYPKRAERLREFAETALALAKVKDRGSHEAWRMIRKLASGMGASTAPMPALLARQQPPPTAFVQRVVLDKTGRNARCTCGSGLKYKTCCGGTHPYVSARRE